MRKIFLLLLIVFANIMYSQNSVDLQQIRIDELDGKRDNYLSLADLDARNSATYTYLTLIDEIQSAINLGKKIPNADKEMMQNILAEELKKISAQKLTKASRDEKRYSFLYSWLKTFNSGQVNSLMQKNRVETFSIINFIYPFPVTEDFLYSLPDNFIDQLLFKYPEYQKADYSSGLIEKLITKAPLTSKKYFVRNEPIYNTLRMSSDININTILSITEKYRRESKAYTLLNEIVYNELSIEEANEIGKNKKDYFKKLLKIRASKNPLAEVSLERELNYEALEYVREVNHLHESTNPDVRFAIVKELKAAELYTLIVYSEDEIFTSSFNGIYERLVSKMKSEKITGFDLLEQVGFNHFRTFIKMISYYGRLNTFLNTMETAERDYVLRLFVGGIIESKDRLVDAVSIANAISVIEDHNILNIFEEEIYAINNSSALDSDSRLIYGLLIKMFNPKVQRYYSFFDSISNLYYTPPIDKIEIGSLLGTDGKNIQKHFFYDDDDGVASFNSFKASFNTPNWIIVNEQEYIKIISTNSRVKIYANKPANDETAWYYADKEMKKNNEVAEIIIHRGHSYYVEETVEKIPSSAKLILLGSCGGYNRLSQLLEKSDNAQIISTKQIGSMGVNNPLIFQMAEKARLGKDIVWSQYWGELKSYFKGRGKAEERFKDYVPPHQNLGAKFIAAYKMYSWVK